MISIRKPKLLPALSCILTFCIVTVVIVDANIPFGYILVQVLKEPESPFLIEILLLVSIVSLLVASFIVDSLRCGILTSLGALGLVFGWVLGMVRFVFYPIYPTPYPAAAKWIPALHRSLLWYPLSALFLIPFGACLREMQPRDR
jgi:hypothetical protein